MHKILFEIIFDMTKLNIVIPLNTIVTSMYSFGNTTVNQSLKTRQHPAKTATNVGNKIPLNRLKGLDILINNINPVSTVKITHIVEYTSVGK